MESFLSLTGPFPGSSSMTIIDYLDHYACNNFKKVTNTEHLVSSKLAFGVCKVVAFCGLMFESNLWFVQLFTNMHQIFMNKSSNYFVFHSGKQSHYALVLFFFTLYF